MLYAIGAAQRPLYPIISVPRFVDAGSLSSQVSFQIANAGGGTLSWNIGDIVYKQAGGWISSINPRNGNTQTASTVTVSISREGLSLGTYTATMPIASNGGTADILISMAVAPPFVYPDSIDFGDTLSAAVFTIKNYTSSPLLWSARCSDTDNQSVAWLSVDPGQGELAGGDNQTVLIRIDRSGLAAGMYKAFIEIILSLNNEQGSERIQIGMTVSDSNNTPSCPVAYVLNNNGEDLQALRKFRDNVLVRCPGGRTAGKLFYANGQRITNALRDNVALRRTVAVMLRAILPYIKKITAGCAG
ncbi:MAG: hypothetical protein N3B18_01980 [Desulfobacterota bacterium]|nr:hypothetical protein [Thermodesulfobacteriota bacterium]